MKREQRATLLWVLNNTPVVLFATVFAMFGLLTPRFLHPGNLANIVIQSSSTAIVAVGMTFVLLTAGVDLSVGAIMFVTAAVAGKLALAGYPLWLSLAVILLLGAGFGSVNALLITRLRLIPFIVTLATLYLGRGFSLWLTQTRAMNLPESFLWLGSATALGIPIPILVLAGCVAVAELILRRTTFGRQIYALGANAEMARKAGLRPERLLAAVYVISGLCAALGGIVSLSQLGTVSPTFGYQKEFAAIAAAVLGGASLFGGRGHVFPGTVLGAILIQTIENALVILNADPYLYPLVTSAIIFIAVLVDSLRTDVLGKLERRSIRVEQPDHE